MNRSLLAALFASVVVGCAPSDDASSGDASSERRAPDVAPNDVRPDEASENARAVAVTLRPWVSLARPLEVSLPAYGVGAVHVSVARQNYEGSIKLTVTGLPSDVVGRVAWIRPGEDEADIDVYATCNLFVTTAAVHLDATDGDNDIHDDVDFDLVVGVPEGGVGALDVSLAGRGYVPISLTGSPGDLVPTSGARALLLTTTCQLARYDIATVSLDLSFGAMGVATLNAGDTCTGLTRAPDGDLFASALVAGKKRIFRVLESGSVDLTYDVRVDATAAWAFDAMGRMTVLGSDGVLRRYDANGLPDATFAATPAPRSPAAMAPLEDGAIVVGTEYDDDPDGDYVSRVVVSHLGPFGGVDSELALPRYLGETWAPETVTWARALPSGDVLLALGYDDPDDWADEGALIRLVRPGAPGAPWSAVEIGTGLGMGTPSFDADGSLSVGSFTAQHGAPGFGDLSHFDANGNLVAHGGVGNDQWHPWSALSAPISTGDGTVLVTTLEPQDGVPVIARLWIRP